MTSREKIGLMENSGMMSCISEAWEIMNKHIGMKYDDIGKIFEKWSTEGELVGTLPFIPLYLF
jgi:6-phosphogluconate dehydrogenase